MTPKKSDATTATLALAVYSLSQQGVYTKEMITFKGDFPCDIELPLCVYQEPNGGFGITLEDKHPPVAIPEQPDPEVPPRQVTLSTTSTLVLTARPLDLGPLPPTLPENPTPKQRWEYLLAVVKYKSAR